jgi:hypothetical protein
LIILAQGESVVKVAKHMQEMLQTMNQSDIFGASAFGKGLPTCSQKIEQV